MSDPMTAPPPAPPPAPAAASPQMPAVLASLGQAQLLMAAGAALIVLTDLIFVVFGPYGFSNVAWAAAMVALLLIFLNARMMGFAGATTRSLLILIGIFAAAIGVRELLSDIQFLNGANVATTYFLGMLGYYAGTVLMALGAWMMWSRKV